MFRLRETVKYRGAILYLHRYVAVLQLKTLIYFL